MDFLFITAFPPAPVSPGTGDGKSIDDEHPNNYNSINSEDVSFFEKDFFFSKWNCFHFSLCFTFRINLMKGTQFNQ